MTINPAKLRANARKLDRLNQKAAKVLAAMQGSESLLLEFRWFGPAWCLSGGTHIDPEVAEFVIKSTSVTSVGDTLFGDALAQTWRWIE